MRSANCGGKAQARSYEARIILVALSSNRLESNVPSRQAELNPMNSYSIPYRQASLTFTSGVGDPC